MSDNNYNSYQGPASNQSDAARMHFILRRMLGQFRTATLAQVIAVYPGVPGAVTDTGTVDVQPLVHQMDGAGNIEPLPVVYGVPYNRLQGGNKAIIIDPEIDDIGLIVFADRDISAVVSTGEAAAPGSNRRNSLADAMFVMCMLSKTPEHYISFTDDGIDVKSTLRVTVAAPEIDMTATTAINLKAPNIKLDGAVHTTGAQTNDSTITAAGDVQGNGTSLHTHKHGGVQSGGSQTTTPV